MKNITHDVANEHIQNHKTLLPLKIRNNTVYTSAKVSLKNFKDFYLNDDIHNPVPLNEEYLGSAPRLSYRTLAVGRTLQQITDEAKREFNDPFEAIVWLRNVIEGIGTLLLQYGLFTASAIKHIPKEHKKFNRHFNEASTFFNFLSEKFSDYRLRSEPIIEIIPIFNKYNQSQILEEDKQKFIKLIYDVRKRFLKCAFLVEMAHPQILKYKYFNVT
ncbi:uncharacterized protein LOC126895078 [Daktulosphaira vitifoliae]|uniref:uncharacterized protein LOC126895078 n=1 Tax=Daktulosphaira vitifoliae TaxID=58002 RepID=UPI0021AA9949|nr:uncharacterized protein LOC126895078 [Daktulosphaira vitifoliae]